MDIIGLVPSFGGLIWTIGAFRRRAVDHRRRARIPAITSSDAGRESRPTCSRSASARCWRRASNKRGTRWQIAAPAARRLRQVQGRRQTRPRRRGDEEVLKPPHPRGTPGDDARRTALGAAATVFAGPAFNFNSCRSSLFGAVLLLRGVASDPLTIEELRPMPGDYALEGRRPDRRHRRRDNAGARRVRRVSRPAAGGTGARLRRPPGRRDPVGARAPIPTPPTPPRSHRPRPQRRRGSRRAT